MVFLFRRFSLRCLDERMNGSFYGFLFSDLIPFRRHRRWCCLSIEQFSWDMMMWMRASWATIDSICCIHCTLERNKNRKHKPNINRHECAMEWAERKSECFLFFCWRLHPAGPGATAAIESLSALLILLFCVYEVTRTRFSFDRTWYLLWFLALVWRDGVTLNHSTDAIFNL